MRINEKDEQIKKCEKIDFDSYSVLMRPSMKKIKKSKNVNDHF